MIAFSLKYLCAEVAHFGVAYSAPLQRAYDTHTTHGAKVQRWHREPSKAIHLNVCRNVTYKAGAEDKTQEDGSHPDLSV